MSVGCERMWTHRIWGILTILVSAESVSPPPHSR